LAVATARDLIDVVCPLLRELVNNGNSPRRCQIGPGGDEENLQLAPFTLYDNILEMGDGVEVLFAQ